MMARKKRGIVGKTAIALVLTAAVLVTVTITYMIGLTASWKTERLAFNDAMARAYTEGGRVEYGGKTLETDRNLLNFFYDVIMDATVFRGGQRPQAEGAIVLQLPGARVVLSDAGDGDAIHIGFSSQEENWGYDVRATMGYGHLIRYLENCIRRAEQ